MTNMNCLVVGGTGAVGSLVVHHLVSLGHRVRVATRDPDRVKSLPDGALAVPFSLEHVRVEDFVGNDRVFCMMPRGVELTSEQQQSLFYTMSEAFVKRVVLMTGLGVDRAVGSPLYQLESALEQSNLSYAIVRPNYMFQNFCSGDLQQGILERNEIAVPLGDSTISFVDARDVARVASIALVDVHWKNEAYDLTGPSSVSHGEIAEAISRAARRSVCYRPVSSEVARVEMLRSGMASEVVEKRLGFLELARRGLFAAVSLDVERVLGKKASGLNSFVDDYAHRWAKELQ